mgnify:CR=1 FL=1
MAKKQNKLQEKDLKPNPDEVERLKTKEEAADALMAALVVIAILIILAFIVEVIL